MRESMVTFDYFNMAKTPGFLVEKKRIRQYDREITVMDSHLSRMKVKNMIK